VGIFRVALPAMGLVSGLVALNDKVGIPGRPIVLVRHGV
jgi:hypothetical protein